MLRSHGQIVPELKMTRCTFGPFFELHSLISLISLSLVFHLTRANNNCTNTTATYPSITIVDVKYYTKHDFDSNATSIPSTFRSLTLQCRAAYPTTWKFFKPVYLEPTLKSIAINSSREISGDNFVEECLQPDKNCSSEFISNLTLNFKYVDEFPKLLCRSSKQNKSCTKSTYVNVTVLDNSLNLSFSFVHSYENDDIFKKYNSTENARVGGNENCSLKLYFYVNQQAFDCGWGDNDPRKTDKNSSKPIPTVISCNTRDECRSIFRPDNKRCNASIELNNCTTTDNSTENCNISSAYVFKPSNSPGVIVCRHPGENISSTNLTIARNYIVTQNGTIHFGIDGPQQDQLSLTMLNNYNVSHVYKNDTEVQFTCKATSSLYMHGFRFIVEVNGTRTDEGRGLEILDTKEDFVYTVTKNITFNTFNGSDISNGSEVSVYCFAPMWDSFEWKNTSISFKVIEPTIPKVTKFSARCEYDETLDSVFAVITCMAVGDPRPTIQWIWGKINTLEERHVHYQTTESFNNATGEVESNFTVTNELRKNFHLKKTAISSISCKAKNFFNDTYHPGNEDSWDPHTDNLCRFDIADSQLYLWVAIGLLAVAFLVSSVIGIYCTKRFRNNSGLDPAEIDAFTNGGDPSLNGDDAFLRPYKLEFEIPRNDITLANDVIGEGEFAKVVFGTYKYQKVAVKMVKKSANVNHFKAFLLEIKTMCYIEKHPNLVNIVGACTRRIKQRDVLLVIEFCSNGNLLKYLKKSQSTFIDLSGPEEIDQKKLRLRSLRGHERRKISVIGACISTINLLTWAVQCASAMEYLSAKRIVHGDLAARNVLLTEQLHAKVGDFGLSKQLSDYSVYVQTLTCPLPLRWMSLEALQDLEFSIQSDIWSFGVLLWEIFSLGQLPYPGIPQWDFQSYIFLQSGQRMEKPKFSNDSIYAMMRDCWEENPGKRPAFEKLKDRLIAELIALQC